MSTFTYEQFEKALAESGGTLSDADMATAAKNPDFGMSAIQYIKNYKNATTPEAKQAAHEGLEQLRMSTGNYSGGDDGSEYLLNTEQTPSSYNLEDYVDPYEDQLSSALKSLLGREDYTSKYDDQINDVLSGNYDLSSNPIYQSYVKSNAQEAQRSAQDALGSSAALTGGMASSAATTAAAQAANYYNSQTAAEVPTILSDYLTQLQSLDDADYQKYIDEIGLTQDDITTLKSLTADDFDRFTTEQSMAYQQLLDNISNTNDREDSDREYELNQLAQALDSKELDINALLQYADLTDDNSPITKYLKSLGLI